MEENNYFLKRTGSPHLPNYLYFVPNAGIKSKIRINAQSGALGFVYVVTLLTILIIYMTSVS